MKRLLRDMAVYAPSQFLPALTAFITTPILTRLFPPAEYGYWALATSMSAFLVSAAVAGFGSAVLRYYPAYTVGARLDVFFASISVSIGVIVIVGAALGFLGLFAFGALLPPPLVTLFPLVILIFAVQSIYSVFITVIRAQGRIGAFTALQLFTNYGGLGIGLFLVVEWGFRVNGLLLGTLVSVGLMLPIVIPMAVRGVGVRWRRFLIQDARQIWQYAWPLALGSVAMWGLRVSDLFIIRLFQSDRDVGLYSVSYNISSKSIELLVALFLLSVSPMIYRTWEMEGQAATEVTLTMVTRVYLIVCVPAAIGLSVLARPFVMLLTSPEYYEGSRIVAFVVFSSFVWGLASIAMLGLTIGKKAGRLAANQAIAASTHIALMILLVPRFGYVAAAVSTLIGYSILLVLQVRASRQYLTWRFPVATLRRVIVATVVMGAVAKGAYALSGATGKASPAFLLLSILMSVVTYVACLWQLREATDAERRSLLLAWNRSPVG